MLSRLSLVLAALVAVSGAADAQAPQQQAPGRSVRALGFVLQKPIPAEMYVHADPSDGETEGIKVSVKNYLNHEADSLPLSMKKVVFTTEPDPASVKMPSRVLARTTLPDRKTSILLFVPSGGKEGEPPFRVMPIADGKGDFPSGSLKILNLSPLEVRITLQDKPYVLKAASTQVIEDPPVGERNASAMMAYSKTPAGWVRIGSGSWPHPGRKRVLQILYGDPQSGQVKMKGFRDVTEPR